MTNSLKNTVYSHFVKGNLFIEQTFVYILLRSCENQQLGTLTLA